MLHLSLHKKSNFTRATEYAIIGLILAIALSAIETIWPIYLESFGLKISTIGFISASMVLVSITTSLLSIPLFNKIKSYNILISCLIIFTSSYLLLYFFSNLMFFIIISYILTTFLILKMESFDIIFRDSSSQKRLAQDEGRLWSLLNLGWLLGPLIAGLIATQFRINNVFLLAAIASAISLIILLSVKAPKNKKQNLDINILKNLKEYVKQKNLLIAYSFGVGIEIWWSLIYIYMPLFIIKSGLKPYWVGIFLSLVVLPLILSEYRVGRIANKIGFRNFFFTGFFVFSLTTLLAFLINDIKIIIPLIILASFGMALIEPMRQTYFFSIVKNYEEEKFYPIFATSGELGKFMGKLIIAIVLLALPSRFAYITMTVMMLFFAFVSSGVKEKIKY